MLTLVVEHRPPRMHIGDIEKPTILKTSTDVNPYMIVVFEMSRDAGQRLIECPIVISAWQNLFIVRVKSPKQDSTTTIFLTSVTNEVKRSRLSMLPP